MRRVILAESEKASEKVAVAVPPSTRRSGKLLWPALGLALLLTATARCFFPLEDPDLWWHIVVGRWILDHGAVPRTEHWNFFGLGQAFRAYSWSSEILYAFVDRYFGMRGLWWLQGFIAIALIATAAAVWRHLSRSSLLTIATTLLFIGFIDPFTSLRPQCITFILFILIPLMAESILKEGL